MYLYKVTYSFIQGMNLMSSKGVGFWRKKGQRCKETITILLTLNEPSQDKFYGLIKVSNPHNEVNKESITWNFFEQLNN